MPHSIQVKPKTNPVRGWLMVITGALFYSYQFVLRVSPNMMTDELMRSFSIGATELSLFTSFYYIAYSLTLIPIGLAMDRYGPKYFMNLGSLVCACGCFLFSLAHGPLLANLSRFLMGAGASCAFLGTLKLGTLWLSPRSFGKVIGLTMVFGTLGAVLGGSPLEWMINQLGWRQSMQALGVLGLALCFLLLSNLKNQRLTSHHHSMGILEGLKLVIASKQAWFASLFGMFMYIPLIILGDLWGVSFLEQAYAIKESIAATIVATLFIGISFGSPSFALLSDRIGKRKILMVSSAFICFLIYGLIVFFNQLPMESMYVLFFMAGFFFGGKSLGFASIVEDLPSHVSGVAVAFANMLVMASGTIALPIVGMLLDFHQNKDSAVLAAARYDLSDFKFAFVLLPICVSLAFLLATRIRETYPNEET